MNDTTDLREADGNAAPAQDAPASAGGARTNGRAATQATTDLPGSDSPAAAPAAPDLPGADSPAVAPAARVRRRAVSGGGLASLVLPELQSLAGDLGITGVARLRKSQLIEAIQERQGGAAATSTASNGSAGSAGAGPAANGSGANDAGPAANGSGARSADPEPVTTADEVATTPTATPAVTTRARQPRARQGSPAAEPASGPGLTDGTQQLDAASASGSAGTAVRAAERDRPAAAAADANGVPGSTDASPGSDGRDVAATRADGPTGPEPTGAAAGPAGQDVSSDRADGSFDADSQRDRNEREGQGSSDRLDRSRERFLEREARRQERAAAQAAGTVEGGAADQAAPADRPVRQERDRAQGMRSDRPQSDSAERSDRLGSDRAQGDRPLGDRPVGDRAQGDRPLSDRAQGDRAQGDRAQGDRADGTDRARQDRTDRPQPARQDRDTPGPLREDEDDVSGRRGRFRERGRGRNRNTRDRFVAGEAEPVIGDDDVLIPIGGILDISDSYGFVRTSGYLTGPNDVYVSLQQVRRYGLRRGDAVTGAVRQQRDGERKDKYNALVRLDTVNGVDPAEAHSRPEFTKLTPLYPQDRLRLETAPDILTTRVIDLVMPVGKGQRALIVSPPKAGKTMVMQAIANAITTNNPEVHLMVVLVDERPEEVTDMQRSVKGEVIASTFDRPPQDHITVAELSIERAKRLVELGHDVVVLLDSITRLGRAYNLGAPASGRILTGGVDSAALYPPKRFLGAARNIENGGSLTIFATALVETGSAMDTVIFEEFKGTGNAELKLDRRLADKRIFPAIDVDASGTRKEEILLAPQELRIVLQLRRVLHALDTASSLELLLDKMKSTRTNVEFLMQIQKTTVDQDQSA